jgi:hypothetical protein
MRRTIRFLKGLFRRQRGINRARAGDVRNVAEACELPLPGVSSIAIKLPVLADLKWRARGNALSRRP